MKLRAQFLATSALAAAVWAGPTLAPIVAVTDTSVVVSLEISYAAAKADFVPPAPKVAAKPASGVGGGDNNGPGAGFWAFFIYVGDVIVGAQVTNRCEDRELRGGPSPVPYTTTIRAFAECVQFAKKNPKKYQANMSRPWVKAPGTWTREEEERWFKRAG
ncbi:hypothetical protein HY418_02225 [Candidatus Kaiserbacteria bacterium]|nr:hypothetical protein [Candidatus Kaiserbacteria bacterium]